MRAHLARVGKRHWLTLGLVLLALLWRVHFLSQHATVLYLQGQVEDLSGPLSAGQRLSPGGKVSVGPQSGLTLLLPDGHQLQVASNSQIVLEKLTGNVFGQTGPLEVKLVKGHLYMSGQTHAGDVLRLATPYSTAGIRGTSLALTVDNASSATSLHSGKIVVSDPLSIPQVLKPGKGAVAANGQASQTSDLPTAPLLESSQSPLLSQDGTVLRWSPVAEASFYRLEVAQDPSFTRVLSSSTTSQPSYTLPPLAEDSPLWVRVFTVNTKNLESLPSPVEKKEYRVHYMTAGRLRGSGDFLRAIEQVQRAMSYYGQDPLVQDEYGWCQYLSGQHRLAEATLIKALALGPKDHSIRLHLARVQYWLGKFDLARQHYLQILLEDSKSADAHWGVAEVATRQNQFEEAARESALALSYQSDHAYAEVTLAEALLRLGRQSEARRHLLRYLGLPSNDRSETALLVSQARRRAFLDNAGPVYRSHWFQRNADKKGGALSDF